MPAACPSFTHCLHIQLSFQSHSVSSHSCPSSLTQSLHTVVLKLQALVYDILPQFNFQEEGAGKRCSECELSYQSHFQSFRTQLSLRSHSQFLYTHLYFRPVLLSVSSHTVVLPVSLSLFTHSCLILSLFTHSCPSSLTQSLHTQLPVCRQTDRQTDSQADRQTDGRTDGRTDGQTDRQSQFID